MAFTPQSVGEARGLLAKGSDYTNQIIGGLKYREAAKAAKIKAEDDDLQKMLGDIKVDYDKFHRVYREPAREKYAAWLAEAYKQYQTKDPAWRTKVSMTGQQLKFDLAQLKDISDQAQKFDELVGTGKYVMDEDATALYDYHRTGEPGKPPKLSGSPYSSLRNYDPETGTGNFIPVEKTDVNKFVLDSVIGDPTEYIIDPNLKSLGNKKLLYTEQGVFDEDKIRLRSHQAIGSPAFVNFVLTNKPMLEKQRQANPDIDPTEIAVKAWEDFVVGQIPLVSKQKLTTEPGDINISNNNGAVPAKSETTFGNISNVMTDYKADPNTPISYEGIARQLGAKIVKRAGTDDPYYMTIDVPSTLRAKTIAIPPQRGYVGKEPIKEGTQGKVNEIAILYGAVNSNGDFETFSEAEYNKLPPNEKAKAIQYAVVTFDEEYVLKKGEKRIPSDWKPRQIKMRYNLEQGSNQVDELNDLDQDLFIKARRETEKGTGKAGAYENTEKYSGQPTPTSTSPKLTFAEWKKQNPEGTVPQYNQYKAQ